MPPTVGAAAVAFTLGEFVRLRPWAYHFTAPANAPRVRAAGRLVCAADLLAAGGRGDLVNVRRRADVVLGLDGGAAVVSHQNPLKPGAVHFDAVDWDFARYVAHLNRRVFFWPGRDGGPVAQGRRHLLGYRTDSGAAPVVFRVRTAELVSLNADRGPWLSRVNSGATRGRAVRGEGTFRRPEDCDFPVTKAAELTFEGFAVLPAVEWLSG